MNVRKFTATTSRDAWRLVRETLGPDAVILSNRTVDGGVEILALAGEDMASLAEPVIEKPAISAQTLLALTPKQKAEKAQPSALPFSAPAAASASAAQPPAPVAASSSIAIPEINRNELNSVMNEIRSMRGMLEMQLAEIAWSDQQKREPAKSSVLREMLAAGFSASLSR